MTRIRSYSELRSLPTFQDRFDYLRLNGGVGKQTFGHLRHVNQNFYASHEWEAARRHVILRDNGCDLGVEGYEIFENPVVHHINTMTADDIVHGELWIIDPEFLITTTHETHNAIHYGAELSGPIGYVERRPGDTTPW